MLVAIGDKLRGYRQQIYEKVGLNDMQLVGLLIVIVAIILAAAAMIWEVLRSDQSKAGQKPATDSKVYTDAASRDVEHIFNDEFREELRNRGRLHFEKIIGENAMFLQQDLRLTTSELNDYMKQEITKTLKDEFAKYEQSIADAKQLAVESLAKTQVAIEEQRQLLGKQMEQQIIAERNRIIERFEQNMAEIINHYVLTAIGNQIDLSDQLEYILSDLEANKQAILEDINNGA